MDLAFLKDETIKSRPVCNEDTFIFGEWSYKSVRVMDVQHGKSEWICASSNY